jgi:hypothetical protein
MKGMTVHEAWRPRRHPRSARLRAVAEWLERALVGPVADGDDPPDMAWDVEPFPGPAAGAGHVRLLPGPRSVDVTASSDRPVVAGSARR